MGYSEHFGHLLKSFEQMIPTVNNFLNLSLKNYTLCL